MIKFPTKNELRELSDFEMPGCVSIYAPYIGISSGINASRAEVKKLIHQAETALKSSGMRPRLIKKTLRPALQLVENVEFWLVNRESLALFVHQKLFRCYRIPETVGTHLLAVENGFYLEPIIDAMKDNKRYYVLALSHKNVRLYEGDHYRLKPVYLKNFPSDMKKALNIDEYPNWRETHTIAPASSKKGSEANHGQYNVRQTDKDMLLEFFRRIDKRLHNFLQHNKSPLVLAGVNYLLPIYRRVNTFPSLIPGGIRGNVAHTSLDSIRQNAWTLVSKIY